jgi:hypothetical protein
LSANYWDYTNKVRKRGDYSDLNARFQSKIGQDSYLIHLLWMACWWMALDGMEEANGVTDRVLKPRQ